MNPNFLFFAFSIMSFICWVPLFIAPYHKNTIKYIQYFYVPIFFAVAYCFCFTNTVISSELAPNVGIMEQLRKIFDSKWGFLTGWVHYLCFDFVVGSYMVIGAKKVSLNRGILFICLFLTFLIGPLGFLIYRSLKVAKNRN